MKHRKKASEIHRETNYVFSKKVPFTEAFPEIDDITVEVKESGHGVYRNSCTGIYGKDTLGEYIDCSNPLCYNGGFSIGRILWEMVRKQQCDLKTMKICQGYEGSPKGRRKYRSCCNSFDVAIKIIYKKK